MKTRAGANTARRWVWQRPSALPVLGLLLAVLVFSIDTFTEVRGAVAVLYVIALLMAAEGLSRSGILAASLACALLTLLSLGVVHARDLDLSTTLRCATALAAIAITTALLLRNLRARDLLVEANRALSLSEQRYRWIFQHASVSLWELDHAPLRDRLAQLRAGGVRDLAAHARANAGFLRDCARLIRCVDVNQATLDLFGETSREAFLGPFEPFVDPETPLFHEILLAVFEGHGRVEAKGRMIRPDGRGLTILFGLNLPEDPQALDRVVASVVDVTQREEMQEALAAAQGELARASRVATVGALSASIAHELNQPLAALVMNAQTSLRWLRRDPPDPDSAIKAAERSVRDGKRASEIVQRIRGMLLKREAEAAPVDLGEVLAEVELLLERELGAQRTHLAKQLGPGLPPILADRVELQQVLVNLISNALRAMEEARTGEPEITIEARSAEGQVAVSLRDRGKGIAEEDLPALFEPFFTTRVGGMGMGLAICRSLVEARGGQLTAANHPEGGAVFRFTLPAAETLEKS